MDIEARLKDINKRNLSPKHIDNHDYYFSSSRWLKHDFSKRLSVYFRPSGLQCYASACLCVTFQMVALMLFCGGYFLRTFELKSFRATVLLLYLLNYSSCLWFNILACGWYHQIKAYLSLVLPSFLFLLSWFSLLSLRMKSRCASLLMTAIQQCFLWAGI